MAFLPGLVLLYWLSSKYRIKLSSLEVIVFGSLIWNFLLIGFSYIISAVSSVILDFFLIFTIISLVILASSVYFIFVRKNKPFPRPSTKDLILLSLCALLLLVIFAFTTSHSIFAEYDAFFYYLPKAESIVKTAGLEYNYYMQTDMLSPTPPGIPLVYAWFNFLCNSAVTFDLAVRVFPFIYIVLTSIVVYLISKEISQDSKVSIIGAISFISMPIVLAVSSNYSLYLDVPFTFLFYSAGLVLLKIYRKYENANFWWFMLGSTISLLLLVKEVSVILLPSLFALGLLLLLSRAKKLTIVSAIGLSIIFVISYNVFLIWDLFHFPIHLLFGYAIRQLPVLVVFVLILPLFYKMLAANSLSEIISVRHLICFSVPLIVFIFYCARNFLVGGIPIPLLILLDENYIAAGALMPSITAEVGALRNLPTILDILRWDVLFSAISLGAIFVIPSLTGLFTSIHDFFKKRNIEKSFLLLSFFLMLLVFWSWAFYNKYEGPELRRLYYFAPLFAIFIAMGIKKIAEATGTMHSLVARFAIFDCLALIYLWAFKFNIGASGIPHINDGLFRSLGVAGVEMLIVFAFFFVVLFLLPIPNLKSTRRIFGKLLHHSHSFLPFIFIGLLSFSLVPVSLNAVINVQENVYYLPEGWQNNLDEVIPYFNQELQDDYTIITCHAHHLSYFTKHPVIEVTSVYGVINLQNLNGDSVEDLKNGLIDRNIRYLLFPNSNHTYYEFFEDLSEKLPALNIDLLSRSPYVLSSKEFSKFNLYTIITQDEAEQTYKYLASFEYGWVPLNDYTNVSGLDGGISVSPLVENFNVIADDYQDAFWYGDKINQEDEITLSNEESIKEHGTNSLKVYIDAEEGVALKHRYSESQDWRSYGGLSFYLYGANTTNPIQISFHTVEESTWEDLYLTSITDDFVGWKHFTIPLSSFKSVGNPTWGKIDYVEISFTGGSCTYYLDQVELKMHLVGVEGVIPAITGNPPEKNLAISINSLSLQSPILFELISDKGDIVTGVLTTGNNLIAIPSELLENGAKLKLYYYQRSTEETLELYYLGILEGQVQD